MSDRPLPSGKMTFPAGHSAPLYEATFLKCSEDTAQWYDDAVGEQNAILDDAHSAWDLAGVADNVQDAKITIEEEAAAYDRAHPEHDLRTADGRAAFAAHHNITITLDEPEPDDEIEP